MSISHTTNTKFWGLIYDNTLSWECLIDQIMSTLSSPGFAMRSVQCVMSQDTLKMMYSSYIHSVITNGIIFGGNLPYSIKVFRTHQKN
jgi:hypothetical protein